MDLNMGTVAIIIAVAFYYLRLVRVEHERRKKKESLEKLASQNSKKGKQARQAAAKQTWLFSPRKRDWIIAWSGFAMIVVGILIRNGVIPSANYQDIWWLPVSIGILAFSFLFG